MRNSKLLEKIETYVRIWVGFLNFLIIYFLVHLLPRSSNCSSILILTVVVHMIYTWCTNRSNSFSATLVTKQQHLHTGGWGRRPQYINFCCKLDIVFSSIAKLFPCIVFLLGSKISIILYRIICFVPNKITVYHFIVLVLMYLSLHFHDFISFFCLIFLHKYQTSGRIKWCSLEVY